MEMDLINNSKHGFWKQCTSGRCNNWLFVGDFMLLFLCFIASDSFRIGKYMTEFEHY